MAVVFPWTFRDGPGNVASGQQVMDNLNALKARADLLDAGLRTGNLDPAAGILDTQLGGNPLSATWRTLARASFGAVGPVAATYIPTVAGAITPAAGRQSTQASMPTLFSLTGLMAVVPTGRTLQYRLYVLWASNPTVFPGTPSFSLAGISFGGGSGPGYMTFNLGTAVSTVAVTPVANFGAEAISAPFSAINNVYTFVVTVPSSASPDAVASASVELQYRYV